MIRTHLRSLLLSSLVVSAPLALVACGGKDKPATTTPDTTGGDGSGSATTPASTGGGDAAFASMTSDQLCDRGITTMQDMGTVVATNAGNCDAMGDALETWAAGAKPFIAHAQTIDQDPAKKADMEKVCASRMEAAMGPLTEKMNGLGACAETEKVKRALGVLSGM